MSKIQIWIWSEKSSQGVDFMGSWPVLDLPQKTQNPFLKTHVQYTQTDTIRQTDGPLVPMVRLVPIENDVIPVVLLVNMHLIKGT